MKFHLTCLLNIGECLILFYHLERNPKYWRCAKQSISQSYNYYYYLHCKHISILDSLVHLMLSLITAEHWPLVVLVYFVPWVLLMHKSVLHKSTYTTLARTLEKSFILSISYFYSDFICLLFLNSASTTPMGCNETAKLDVVSLSPHWLQSC